MFSVYKYFDKIFEAPKAIMSRGRSTSQWTAILGGARFFDHPTKQSYFLQENRIEC